MPTWHLSNLKSISFRTLLGEIYETPCKKARSNRGTSLGSITQYRDTGLARTVDVMMAQEKRIYIFIIEIQINEQFSFRCLAVSSRINVNHCCVCFYRDIETLVSLEELGKSRGNTLQRLVFQNNISFSQTFVTEIETLRKLL